MSGSVDELPLAAAFARGLDVFTRSQSGDADADTIAAGTAAMRHAVTRVDVEGLLSPNETGDDFPTENLKFLMATWYLAELVSRSHTFDPSSRLTCLVETSSLYEQFLTQCEQHEMLGDAAKIVRARGVNGDRPDPATAREEKVQRFKRERLINEKLLALDKSQFERRRVALAEADWDDEDPEDPGSGGVENETEARTRWLLLVENAVAKTLDGVSLVTAEKEMLERRMENDARSGFVTNCSYDEHGGETGGEHADRSSRNGRRPSNPPSSVSGMGNYIIQPGGSVTQIGRGYVPPGARQSAAAQIGRAVEMSAEQLHTIQLAMQSRNSSSDRSTILGKVFRPGHVLPTMTVEQHGEIEYSELVERTAREKSNAAKKKLEESLRSDEEIETRALEKARTWDEFKDDNPFGSGNSKLRPCG
jgi:hypothetical protein